MESQAQSHPEEDKKQSRTRYEHLRNIEKKMQEVTSAANLGQAAPLDGYEKLSTEEKNNGKYMVTFPYPYMNGFMHLGHAFSLSKCEFQARYQRQLGKNVLFPFSFHCTGMPIQAAANRLKREIAQGKTKRECKCAHETPEHKCPCPKIKVKDPKQQKECTCVSPTQFEILQSIGILDTEIPKFVDPLHWLMYFPPEAQQDLQTFGLFTDWRRSFITTNVNPYYDSFIRWQFNILKNKDKVRFGKRYTIYSEQDKQPCADHDRSKGEGVGPQEYTLIKMRVLELPQSLQEQFNGKNVFLVAATLRPETMYGQTNCYVLPEGEYGVFEMKNDEYFICSERSARNMAFQELTKEWAQYNMLAKVSGQDLIGTPLKAPMTKYDVVYALPMQTITMGKGTGIVTSVPSDSPDDWAALRDLQTKKGLREKYNVKEEWCMPFEPIPIIEIPGFGNLSAVKVVEDMKIQSQKDKEKLAEAKDKVYLKGFTDGVMLVGDSKDMKVQDAKPIVRKTMIDSGLASPYHEPENEIVSRSGDQCIVALCDQWFLTYGEENWKNFVKSHVKSDNFQAYNPKNQIEFEETLDWLNAWACSRTSGLGTQLPWDDTFVIESLSDSTIYMAYYTVSHLLQGGVMDGSKPGPLGIKPEQLNDQVWDYIFRKGLYPEGSNIPEDKLKQLRGEFEYWYPMNLRCSGKDLIRNHLTMSLYNHAAVWEDKDMLPRGFFCNGYLLINGKKMSKSEGNFLTVRDCVEKYGVDATRMALADSGDSLDDANFDELVANSAILRLFVFEKWLSEEIKKHVPQEGLDYSTQPNYDTWDNILDNEINNAIDHTTKYYNEIKYKQVLKHGFFEIQNIKDDYMVAKKGNINPFLLMKLVETQLILINPIVPHFAQYCWETHVLPVYQRSQNMNKVPAKMLLDQGWPQVSKPYDGILRRMLDYLKSVKSSIRVAEQKAQAGGKKGKAGKQQKGAAEEKKSTENCALFVALEYPDWQKQTLEILQGFEFDHENKIQGNFIQAIKAKITGPKQGQALKFAAHIAKEAEATGKEAALEIKTPFDEKELLEENSDFIFENMPTLKHRHILRQDDPTEIENSKNAREAAVPGKPHSLFY